MKKFTSLLICCSLALVGAALAQQPPPEATPNPKAAPAEKGKGQHQGKGQAQAQPQGQAQGQPQGQGHAMPGKGAQKVAKPETTTAPVQNAAQVPPMKKQAEAKGKK